MEAGILPVKNFIKALGILALTVFSVAGANAKESSGKFDPGQLILHHVADSHEWHFATVGESHITLPLPVILYAPDSGGLKIFSSSRFHTHSDHKLGEDVPGHAEGDVSHAEGDAHLAQSTGTSEHESGDHPHKIISGIYEGYGLDEHDQVVATDGHKFYDFSITRNVASMLLSVTLLLLVFSSVAAFYKKDYKRAPQGLARVFEPLIIFLRDEVARPMIGPKADKFLPYLLTVFFFIWFNNLLGLLPGGANLTGNIAVTLTLALFTFFITNFSANKEYWGHIFWTPGVPWWLKTVLPIMPIVEFIGIFTKPVSLMIRLFANITAGHIIILSLLSLIFIFESMAVGVVSALFASLMNILEFLVAILQAYVFTLLSASYIGAAVAEHHHDDHAHDHAHDHDTAHDFATISKEDAYQTAQAAAPH